MLMQVLSSTVADALTFEDRDDTIETRQFIRMMDMFFDCLNVRNTVDGKVKRKDFRKPYRSQQDERFKVLVVCYVAFLILSYCTWKIVAENYIPWLPQ